MRRRGRGGESEPPSPTDPPSREDAMPRGARRDEDPARDEQADGEQKPGALFVAGWLAAIGLLLMAAWWSRPAVTATPGRHVIVLAETPNLTELSADSAALRYYAGQGVSGILVRASTLGSLSSGGNVALATGAEILRLFRMEGIVNIFMWEQIRERPLRVDATYVFTNDLALHENILAALQRDLGEEAARPYRDGEHEFGGEIPGNYIIEIIAPIEVVRGIGVGVEGMVRQRLTQAGIEPVVEVVTAADVKALPEPLPVLLVTGNAAAEALWSERRPGRILLTRGVRNPGWEQAVLAERPAGETFAVQGGAVIVGLSEIGPVLARLRELNFNVGAAAADPGAGREQPWRRWTATACLALALAWTITWLAGAAWSLPARILAWTLSIAAAAISPSFFPEGAGILLAALTGLVVLRRGNEKSREELGFQTALGIAAILLAGQLVPIGRPAPDPWTVALLALAAAAAWNIHAAESSAFLIAGIALAASRLLPTAPPAIALLLAASLAAPAVLRRVEIREAVQLLAWPSALAILLNPDVSGPARGGLAVLALVAIVLPLFPTTRRA